jgi:hypothetical protein
MGYQELDWNRRIRGTLFPRVITVCNWYRMARLNAQHSFLRVRSVIQISAQKGTVMSVRRFSVVSFSTFTQIPLWLLIYFVLFHESLRPVSTNKYVPVVLTVAVTTTWKSSRVFRVATLAECPPENSVEIGAPS